MSNPIRKLPGGRLGFHDHVLKRYVAKAESGTTLAEALHPQFLENELVHLEWGTEVAIISDDLSLDIVVRIVTKTKTTAKVRLLHVFAEPGGIQVHPRQEEVKNEVGDVEEYRVEYGGPNHKFRVMQGKQIIEKGFGTKEEAEAKMQVLVKATQ